MPNLFVQSSSWLSPKNHLKQSVVTTFTRTEPDLVLKPGCAYQLASKDSADCVSFLSMCNAYA